MSKFFLFFITAILLSACKPQTPIENIILQDVTIIPMNGTDNYVADIEILDSKINAIGNIKENEKSTVIDGEGKFIIPGLTEMHAHIPTPEEGDDSYVKEVLFLYLSQGVTTIRGMLGDPYHLVLRKNIEAGEVMGPRVYTSSPSMNGNSVTTPEEAIEKVKQYKIDGYDFLKIHPGIQLNVWDALESTAKEVAIPFSGHVPVEVGIHRALESGYATIDHLDGYIDGLVPKSEHADKDGGGFFGFSFTDLVDTGLIDGLVQKTKNKQVAVVPTQTLFTRWFSPTDPIVNVQEPEMKYMPSKTRFSWRQNKERMINDEAYSSETWKTFISIRKQLLKALDDAGVTILLGSDAPQVMNVPGFSLHHEMKDMADAGMSNYDILQSGTQAPAEFFNASDKYGTIEKGKSADFILLDENPLDNISNASQIVGVMYRGNWLSREMIDERLKEIEDRHLN